MAKPLRVLHYVNQFLPVRGEKRKPASVLLSPRVPWERDGRSSKPFQIWVR